MTKISTICLKCGKVQTGENMGKIMNDYYIVLDKKMFCPNCQRKTNFIATKDVENLKEKIEKNPSEPLDSYIIKLLKK